MTKKPSHTTQVLNTAKDAVALAHRVMDMYAATCITIRRDDYLFEEAEQIMKRLMKASGKQDKKAIIWFKKVKNLERDAKDMVKLAQKGKLKYSKKDLL